MEFNLIETLLNYRRLELVYNVWVLKKKKVYISENYIDYICIY